ncbi:hypothetical protein PMAYCL1PPCAC_26279, partial [Pristionchus mayeri]
MANDLLNFVHLRVALSFRRLILLLLKLLLVHRFLLHFYKYLGHLLFLLILLILPLFNLSSGLLSPGCHLRASSWTDRLLLG